MRTRNRRLGAQPDGPRAIGWHHVWHQFYRDVFDKETHSAATYSYMWIADQVGHIGVGMLLYLVPAAIWVPGGVSSWILVGALLIPALWEYRTYRDTERRHNGLFPLDRAGLWRNVATATAYMWIGVLLGAGFMLGGHWAAIVFVGMLVAAAAMVPWWLRQKITWQKAALPYLARLGTVACPISADRVEAERVATRIQHEFVDGICAADGAGTSRPETAAVRQLVVCGSILSGRTRLVAAIGTELCFRRQMVRYLNFGKLLEMVRAGQRDESLRPVYTGPDNILYWRWRDAEVLIVDDINAALLSTVDGSEPDLERFKRVSSQPLAGGAALRHLDKLRRCHTVWVIGEVDDPAAWARFIGEICGAPEGRGPIVAHLTAPADRARAPV